MTVDELIEELKRYPPDSHVYIVEPGILKISYWKITIKYNEEFKSIELSWKS